MGVKRIFRALMGVLSALGLGASVYAYAGSYSRLTMNTLPLWAIGLHVGTIALILPIVAVEHSALRERGFFWHKFASGRPKWIVPTMQILGVFFFVHFLVFLIQSHVAGPGIKNGEYVLESHGRIVRVITESEYLKLKAAELRFFATGWMFFYFTSSVCWWFPGNWGQGPHHSPAIHNRLHD